MSGLGFTVIVLLVAFLVYVATVHMLENKEMSEFLREHVPFLDVPYCSRAPLVALCEMGYYEDDGAVLDLINKGKSLDITWCREMEEESLNVICNAGVEGRVRRVVVSDKNIADFLTEKCGISAVVQSECGGLLVKSEDKVAVGWSNGYILTGCEDVVKEVKKSED